MTPTDALQGSRRRLMLAYGLGDAGTGLAATQLGFYLFPFFICAAGLPAFIAGSLLTVSKVWDALNDPLIGWLSDHTRSRWGPRLPWMLTAALPLGISLTAMWWVPPGDTLQRTTYYAVMAVLLMTAYTSVNLPYAALSTELTPDTAIRTRLNAARFTGSILAGLSGLIVASVVLTDEAGATWLWAGSPAASPPPPRCSAAGAWPPTPSGPNGRCPTTSRRCSSSNG